MPRSVPTSRIVALPCGFVALGVAGFMALCAAVGGAYSATGFHRPGLDDHSALEMLASALISGAVGGLLLWWGRPAAGVTMRRREATITTTAVWALTGLLGALPFVIDTHMAWYDAIFEAISGFTTTGATVVGDIERSLSRPVLLWRSLIQWLGGMGVVVLFIAIFPNLGISGKHMFRTEVPGHSPEGLRPKITETSWALWRLYAAFTAVQIGVMMALLSLWIPRTRDLHPADNLFDAVCHGLTTLATGGFSTHNDSIKYYDSALLEASIVVATLMSGVSYALYYGALTYRGRRSPPATWRARLTTPFTDAASVFRRSFEFRAYAISVAAMSALVTIAIVPQHDGDWLQALRHSVFAVAMTVTSTGYAIDDHMAYPGTALALLIMLMLSGAMSGSTSGGIKVSRLVLLAEFSVAELRRSVRPAVVQITRLGREVIADDTLHAVASFFFLYMACLGLGTTVITYTDGVALATAFGAMLSALSNMGPAPFYDGDVDNFVRYTPTAKLLFSFAMVLGRLEFITVLALLVPDLWRR